MPTVTRRSVMALPGVVPLLAVDAPAPVRFPKTLRLALLGLQGHSQEITQPLATLPDVNLVAIYDEDPAAVARLVKNRVAAKARQYSDYRRLLDSEKNLDVIAICGPHSERAAAILAALAYGANVIAEKPLAFERTDLEKIKSAVARRNASLGMLLPMRFEGPYQKLREIVQSGAIGEVAQIASQKSYKLGERPAWMLKRNTFGGAIPFIGVHSVDLMRFTTGRDMIEAASLQAHIGLPQYGEMENTAASIFRLDNGGVADMRIDFLRPAMASTHGDDRLRIAGTKGVAEFQEHSGLTLMTESEKPRTITEFPPVRSVFVDFLEAVYLGKPAGLSLRDIYRVNEIVLAAREAAETHRIVKV